MMVVGQYSYGVTVAIDLASQSTLLMDISQQSQNLDTKLIGIISFSGINDISAAIFPIT